MKVTVERVTSWKRALNAARETVGKPPLNLPINGLILFYMQNIPLFD